MNTANFSEYLQNPSLLYQISYEELKTLIVQYPYSQNLRYLIAQKSNMESSDDYEHFLRSAAIISTDRGHLYQLLKSDKVAVVQEESFILEEETLELKELDVLDLNAAEPIAVEVATTAPSYEAVDKMPLEVEAPTSVEELLDEEDLPDLPVEEEVQSLLDVEDFEEEIPLPTLEEESLDELLKEEGTPPTVEEVAIAALIDATAETDTVATPTSLADLLEEEEERQESKTPVELAEGDFLQQQELQEISLPDMEEISLQDLFETVVEEELVEETLPDSTPIVEYTELETEAEDSETDSSLKKLLGEQTRRPQLSRKRKRRMPQFPKSRLEQGSISPVVEEESTPTISDIVESNTVGLDSSLPIVEVQEANIAERIKQKEEQVSAYVSQSIVESTDIASETYANLLIRQQQYEKAIQVYERLKLIFPEKNTFFAQQIEHLGRKLQ
ncbi:MAG: hypothetical protein AAF738_08395 [Bacteroidota bacterium]